MKLLLIYKLLLDIAYPMINSTFLYLWKNPIYFNLLKYIESLILFLFLTKKMLKIKNETVKDLLIILYTLNFIPITTIYSFLNLNRKIMYIFFISYLFLIYIIKMPVKNKKKISINTNILGLITLIIGIILVLHLYNTFGKPNIIEAFHYKKLYAIREKNQLKGIYKYIFYNYIYLGIPLILITIKNKFKHFFVVIIILVMYIYIPRKIILTYLIVYYLIYFCKGILYRRLCYFYIIFLMLGIITKNILLIGMSDRVFYLPAYLSFIYWEFFKDRPFNYFAGSKIGYVLSSKNIYGSYTHKISNVFWGTNMNANANFIASAYAEGGTIVIIISLIILAFILITVKKITRNLKSENKKIIYMLLLVNILILTNGPIWTLFLTNGLFIVLLLLPWIIYSK